MDRIKDLIEQLAPFGVGGVAVGLTNRIARMEIGHLEDGWYMLTLDLEGRVLSRPFIKAGN